MKIYTFKMGDEIRRISASDVDAALNWANETFRRHCFGPYRWVESGKQSFELRIPDAK